MKKTEGDEILYFCLKNNKETTVAREGDIAQYPSIFLKEPNVNRAEGGFRNVFRKDIRGSIQYIVKESAPSFQGNRSLGRAAEVFLSLMPRFSRVEASQKQSFDSRVRRFAHNLVNFQKKFKEPFDRLIPDNAREHPFSDLKFEIKRRVDEDTASAAADIAAMSLRATDLDAQIETLRVLGGYEGKKISLFNVNLKRASYRLTNPFIADLAKKNVSTIIDIEDSTLTEGQALISHGLFNVSIWQLFDNACKYVRPDTNIRILMDSVSPKRLIIKMTSVTIEPEETELIFLENTRGKHARKVQISKDEESNGIGLYIVRKALQYMKAKIFVTNDGYVDSINGIPYSNHTFTIEFVR